ncbi:2755_t:CDS:1, partial [Gigaspora margarita]
FKNLKKENATRANEIEEKNFFEKSPVTMHRNGQNTNCTN